MSDGFVKKISGPLVVAGGMKHSNLYDVVRVSEEGVLGEIIEMHDEEASIQVYEDMGGLGAGEKVVSLNHPLSVECGPGLLGNIYDGIQRPLQKIYEKYGPNLIRGVELEALDRKQVWDFQATVEEGQEVHEGECLGTVQETKQIRIKILVPNGVSGKVVRIQSGKYMVEETIAMILTSKGEVPVTMLARWPVRKARPFRKKKALNVPMVTGQRVIDTFFPIAQGGVAAVPGPFGSGKTVIQHQLAKWADVDIVVYIGCGERGNEMTDVLNEFPQLKDPKTGQSLMERMVLIANTSDMPVAAREASIYTGITIAEYYRDMGFKVALMADSTSRWAEALREMSGRLEEMPGEEGYPAYLGSRLAQFYERAGKVETLGGMEGSLSVIGAVSPPGGDISEPVSQATLRIVKVFWGLDSNLAYQRHFPAINWLNSYSLYLNGMRDWYRTHMGQDYETMRQQMMILLQEEASLQEIVQMVGMDSLSKEDRLTLEMARSIREDYLHQNSFHEQDTYTSLNKQYKMMKLIMAYDAFAREKMKHGTDIEELLKRKVREEIGRFKYCREEEVDARYEELMKQLEQKENGIGGEAEYENGISDH